MKKFLLFFVQALLCSGMVYAYGGGGGSGGARKKPSERRYEVTVQNLTKGQPLTPPVVVAHLGKIKANQLGEQASDGLADLAQDGVTATLKAELDANKKVLATAVGDGVILPGEKQTIVITVPRGGAAPSHFSVLSMLARTNDAFIVGYGQAYSSKNVYLARVYDAGVEHNSEDCAHIPAPPCGNHDKGTDGGEGFVRFHEGLHLQRDLNGQRDTFANFAARIEVKRLSN